jgi:hypothetical protein
LSRFFYRALLPAAGFWVLGFGRFSVSGEGEGISKIKRAMQIKTNKIKTSEIGKEI